VFNLGERTITILDPIPVPDKWKKSLLNKDTLKLKDISFHLNIALKLQFKAVMMTFFYGVASHELGCQKTMTGGNQGH
jgi:hypothetical protein